MAVAPTSLLHFSEDPDIGRFIPHVPLSNPLQSPAVWSIDPEHAPLYWFPRDCPRVTAWPHDRARRRHFEASFTTTALRVHAVELAWLDRVRRTELWCYTFDPGPFRPWPEASGQWVADTVIEPIGVEPVGDLLQRHIDATIELRVVPSLWPLHEFVQAGDWDFSIVRMANARPQR
jgi:hypothetical protein